MTIKANIYFIYLFLLLCGLHQEIDAASPLRPEPGRIVRSRETAAGIPSGSFWVVRANRSGNEFFCTQLNGVKSTVFTGFALKPLPFFEGIQPVALSQFALYEYAHGENGDAFALASILGGTKRIDTLKQFDNDTLRTLHLLRTKQRERNQSQNSKSNDDEALLDQEETEEEIIQLLEKIVAGESIKNISESGDFFLAVAVFERAKGIASRYATRNNRTILAKRMTEQADELVNAYALRLRGTNVRKSRYQSLFPDARGMWSESAPVNYRELLLCFERSYNAFLALDDYSANGEFRQWGQLMLELLLFCGGTPDAAPWEAQFDAALEKYRKNQEKK